MSQEGQGGSGGLFEVLPKLGFQDDQLLGLDVAQIMDKVFPNSSAMYSWFAGLSGKSLQKFGLLPSFLGGLKGAIQDQTKTPLPGLLSSIIKKGR